jgi:hypothetical protein
MIHPLFEDLEDVNLIFCVYFKYSFAIDGHWFQTSDTPDSAVGMHDPVSAHIPLKVEEKIWRGEYIHFRVLLKSAKELASDSMLDGDLVF